MTKRKNETVEEYRKRRRVEQHKYYIGVGKDRERNSKLKRAYGITLEKYDAMLELQGGHCAVCDRVVNDNGKHLHVDHDHVTGKIRGILCSQHNSTIGYCDDDPLILLRLAEYLLNASKS
jgi:hypothetical protein